MEALKQLVRQAAGVAFAIAIGALAFYEALRAAWRAAGGRWEEAKDILRPLDKGIAGARGWGMDYTVSAWCGTPELARCRYCRIICTLAGLLERRHCPNAAENEKLVGAAAGSLTTRTPDGV